MTREMSSLGDFETFLSKSGTIPDDKGRGDENGKLPSYIASQLCHASS